MINAENRDLIYPNDLVTFFDNHDESRFLNLKNNRNRLHETMAFLLACRILVILYGDEQYLFNATNNGNDPYDRVWMSSFNTETTAYTLIRKMAALRQENDAIAYGTSRQRWIKNDVYIFERRFFGNVVLVAINKSDTASSAVSGLLTSLPAGT